jgi:hypothetical protein
MARACAIRITRHRVEVVTAEGGKSPRPVEVAVEPVEPGEDRWAAVTDALKLAGKEVKVDPERIRLVVDSGLAAYRTLRLPIADRSKIEQVIKFEVEGLLPQWDIEDLIVDWYVTSATEVESQVLVTAVPKDALRPLITACEKAGLEPLEVELEGTAIVQAAESAGLLVPGEVQVLLHVGEANTALAVVADGKLVNMRAIHVGAMPGGAEGSGVEGSGVEARRDPVVSVERLRREVARSLAGLGDELPLGAVLVCGHELAGLAGSDVAGARVVPMELLPEGETDRSEREQLRKVAAAWGAALRASGSGTAAPKLRREELRYAGKFERIELPLAVFALLLVTFLGVHLIVSKQRIEKREDNIRTWLVSSNNYMLDDVEAGTKGRIDDPPKVLRDYAQAAAAGNDPSRTPYEQLENIKRLLYNEIKTLEQDVGIQAEIPQPMSSLGGLTLVLGTIHDLAADGSIQRFNLRRVKAATTSRTVGTKKQEMITVTLDMTFFGDDSLAATEDYDAFVNALEGMPWLVEFHQKPSNVLEGGRDEGRRGRCAGAGGLTWTSSRT